MRNLVQLNDEVVTEEEVTEAVRLYGNLTVAIAPESEKAKKIRDREKDIKIKAKERIREQKRRKRKEMDMLKKQRGERFRHPEEEGGKVETRRKHRGHRSERKRRRKKRPESATRTKPEPKEEIHEEEGAITEEAANSESDDGLDLPEFDAVPPPLDLPPPLLRVNSDSESSEWEASSSESEWSSDSEI